MYGNTINNKVVLKEKSTATLVYGGFIETRGDARKNVVTIEDSTILNECIGGYTVSGKAESNEVHLTKSSASMVIGGGYYYLQKGDVLKNIVTLENNSKAASVYGGFSTGGNADGNEVTLENNSKAASVYGGFSTSGNADGNEVTGSDSTISFTVYGGWGTTGASNNKVKLDNVTVSGNVDGGKTDSGAASGNEVSLSNGTTFKGDLYAGYTDDGDAIGNKLELTDISQEVYDIYSSFTNTGQAGGEVTLTNSQVDNVYGGKTGKGAANGSKVIGKGDTTTIGGSVYGGQGTTGASSNTVDLENVKVSGKVRGGETTSGDASGNKVTLSNKTTFAGDLYAGYTENGNATGNEVSLYDVSAPGNVYASYTANGQAGGIDDDTRSKVTIKKSSVTGSVYGGYGSLDTSYNTVELSDGAYVGGDVVGGHSAGDSATRQNVLHNEVTVSSGSRVDGDVYGSMAEGNDDSNPGSASQNKVRIESGSTVGGSVYGGWNSNGETVDNFIYVDGTVSGGVTAGYTRSGDAVSNEVLVEGGTVLGHLYGGYTALGNATGNVITVKGGTVKAEIAGGYDDGTATDNTVTLYDSARFTDSDIYGGKNGGSSTDVFTRNTFNVYGQIDAASLQNFQNLNFYDVAADKASVDLSRSAVIGDGKGSMTNVYIGNLRNQEGDIPDEYVLIHTPTASSSYTGTNLYVNGDTVVTIGPDGSYVPYSGIVANDGTMDNATGSTGMTKSQTLTKGFLTFEVDYFIKNGQDLIARWKKDAPVDVTPETEEFTASRQASAALMDEGADFVAGEGIDRALQASQCLPGEPCGAKAFVAVNGGYSTYKAGTTFDMSYGNMLAGIARQCKIGPVGYLAGVFFETGLSRFHSEYEPDDSRSIDSEGHDYYYGAGALAKVFLNRDLLKGLYAEGSIRYGLMMGDWQSHDIQSDGQTADWDGRAPYLTAHGGLGYMWNVTDNVTADVYAKYFWGHLWGDDGTICGQQFEFDDIYSSRVRTGARLNFKKDETFSWYLGGAWEHQFDSKSRGTIYGYDVPSTDLKGNTAIAEAGVFFKPAADSDFSFMLGTTGYFGEKREGVTGHLQVRYEF